LKLNWQTVELLLTGVLLGIVAQYVLVMALANGEYNKLSPRQRRGVILTGGLASLAAGLAFLGTSLDDNDNGVWLLLGGMVMAGIGASQYVSRIQRRQEGGNHNGTNGKP
jgi:O-antigen ligase